MPYGKLPVVFLSAIASEKEGSVNGSIASYILEHLDGLKNMGIRELARQCHVSDSSISRFCREIGLRDYAELKELFAAPSGSQQYSDRTEAGEILRDYSGQVCESIKMVERSINMGKIAELCRDIRSYQRVAAFGLLKSEGVAMSLQSDLLMLGKKIDTKLSYRQQLDYMKRVGQDDLIILFSYTGIYFDYQRPQLPENLKEAKLYFITGSSDVRPGTFSQVISFDSRLDNAGNPYAMQFVEGLIVREYERQARK